MDNDKVPIFSSWFRNINIKKSLNKSNSNKDNLQEIYDNLYLENIKNTNIIKKQQDQIDTLYRRLSIIEKKII